MTLVAFLRYGYSKANGHRLVAPRFDDAQAFDNGRAHAIEGGRTVVVRPDGHVRRY